MTGDFGDLFDGEIRAVAVDLRQMTRIPGVFAGGDVVRGPCEVVIAVRDARAAVDGIEAYLAEAGIKRG
jgi:NADPH-dependent glutamate synthase beta subunit-like oxidoreductase